MRKNTKKVAFLVACLVFLITGCFGNSKVESERTVIKSMYMPVFIPCMILQINRRRQD